jgi:hypothetical protein
MKPPTALAAAIVALPCLAFAQDPYSRSAPVAPGEAAAIQAPTFGSQKMFVAYTAHDARPLTSTTTYGFDNTAAGSGIFRTGGSGNFRIPVHLPSGARVTELEASFCDTDIAAFAVHWVRQPKGAPAVAQTGSSGAPVRRRPAASL